VHIADIATLLKRERGVGNELSSYYQLNRLSKDKFTLIICIVLSMFVVTAQIMTASASVNLPHMTLTIIGSKGTTVVLNETGIGNLPSHRAVGGRINSVGTKSGLGNYTGVPINTFCQMVGGLHLGQILRVTASDSFVQNFTYAQVNGDFATYDNSGHKVQHNQTLTTMLAYYFNDKNLTSGGPLRFAIVGPEGLYTNSTYWVQKVVKLEVLGTAEYTLTVDSLPTGVNFTVNGTSYTTLWSGIYNDGSSVSLVMPEIHTISEARYYWNQWSDGNISRSRTITITGDTTLTAYYTGPYYELAVNSSPIAGISFTINGTLQTTPYSEWLLEGSYTLIMPETHSEYVWSHWLEDADPSRTKTITLTSSTTWTGVFEFAVPPYGPTAEFTVTPETAYIGKSVKFDASSSQSGWNGTHERLITEYRWDFGDGNKTTAYTPIVYHRFTSSGNYYVELTVYSPGATPETDAVTLKVTITTVPVGGYSITLNTPTEAKPLMFDILISAILAPIFITVVRGKRCRKKN
jgi:PKD repeat protein